MRVIKGLKREIHETHDAINTIILRCILGLVGIATIGILAIAAGCSK